MIGNKHYSIGLFVCLFFPVNSYALPAKLEASILSEIADARLIAIQHRLKDRGKGYQKVRKDGCNLTVGAVDIPRNFLGSVQVTVVADKFVNVCR